MGFGDLKKDAGIASLNKYLADRSYVEGYVPSQGDVAIFQALSGAPAAKHVHALRWYNQVASYKSQFSSLPGVKKPIGEYGGDAGSDIDDSDGDDDDVDLFGSTDSEEEEAVRKLKEERIAKYTEKKAKKPAVIAKSNIILDIKPWDDETDMADLEKKIREIATDGLLWGASKLVPLAYGIKKLQISCVVEDDKVSLDFLEERTTAIEDLVQSMDVAAFNKV